MQMIIPSNDSYAHAKVSRLTNEDSRLLKSSSSLGAFHLVVEELVWNSIQACAKSVDVFIDKFKFLVMVKDDGHGINELDLRNGIGEWGQSSKIRDNKGQCLAAMVSIVDSLEVISSTNDQSAIFSKKMNHNGQVDFSEVPSLRESISSNGTIVIAYNVFGTLPVRQKCIRWEYEFAKIKDWIMRMSLLHHTVNFTITNLSQNRVISNINSSASVVQSLISQFGYSITNKVCHVDISFHGYRLVGLISQPKHDCCLSNKDQQMLFVHGRLIERCDMITSLINKAFTRYLATQNRSGFNARHMDLQAESNLKFPFFVLQVLCPGLSEDYDILVEPNKSCVFFRQPGEIEQLVIALLRHLQQAFPSFQHVIDTLMQQNSFGDSLVPTENSDLQQSPAIRQRLLQQTLYRQSLLGSKQKNFQELLDDAFELTSSPMKTPNKVIGQKGFQTPNHFASTIRNQSHQPSPSFLTPFSSKGMDAREKRERIGVTMQRFSESSRTNICKDNGQNLEAEALKATAVDYFEEVPLVNPQSSSLLAEVEEDDKMNFENNQQELTIADKDSEDMEPVETIGEFLLQSENCLGQYLRHCQVPISDVFVADDKDKSSTIPNVRHVEHSPDRLIQQDPNRKKRSLADIASTIAVHEVDREENSLKRSRLLPFNPRKDNVSLQRDAIVGGNLQCIGQLDRKYISCCITQTFTEEETTEQRQLLALLDQHAIDERVQLEILQQSIISSPIPVSMDRQTILLSPPERLSIDWTTMQILRGKQTLLQHWCFMYHILPSSLSIMSSSAVDDIQESPYLIDLMSVPMVCGDEVLTAEDFIEFCAFLHMNREIPDSLQAPPAVHRILTSKACRSALKFGQVLQRREMESLLARWQETKVPFQCAHGRPSVVPMVDLTSLVQIVASQEASYEDIPQITDRLAALAPSK